MKHRDLERRTCVHFNGVGFGTRERDKACAAGVVYSVLAPTASTFRLPCLPALTPRHEAEYAPAECPSFRLPTDEELTAWEAQIQAAFDAACERTRQGLCPSCGAQVERRTMVGRCAYAEPCGHRLGQVAR